MRAFFAITKNTFREARREKLVLLAAFVALMLVGAANYFLKLDLGHERLKFVFDFSNGALGFFGSIIAVVLSCKTFHSELENRTIVTLLSKPVRAWQFVFGKMSGVGIMLGVFAARERRRCFIRSRPSRATWPLRPNSPITPDFSRSARCNGQSFARLRRSACSCVRSRAQ